MHQRWVVTALLGAVMMTACGGREEPQTPAPTINQDSIDAANRARDAAEREAAERDRLAREAEARRRAEAEARRMREVLTSNVHFDFDQSALTSQAEQRLSEKATILRNYPQVRLRIAGHADERGSTEYNLALGQRRAQAVRDFFAAYGLDGSRFDLVSYGEERPLATGSTESAWAQNRRAEFVITAGDASLNP